MALVGRVCNRFKPFVEAWNAAAILGRPILMPLAFARAKPAFVRSLNSLGLHLRQGREQGKILRTNSLSVARWDSLEEWNVTPKEVNRCRCAMESIQYNRQRRERHALLGCASAESHRPVSSHGA